MFQPDFFDSNETLLLREISQLKESNAKVRKSQFAQLGELKKNYQQLLSRIDILEQFICKENQTNSAPDLLATNFKRISF